MEIWQGNFRTESRLAAVIGHEQEMHYGKHIPENGYGANDANEVEAYQYNIDNAKRFGNTPKEIQYYRDMRDLFQNIIDEKKNSKTKETKCEAGGPNCPQ